tara:strand:+ start:67 stop:351 length:285 start_codon:yes stop_codon:yes gene_type:complete
MADILESERRLLSALVQRLDRPGEPQPTSRSLRRIPDDDGIASWVSCLQAVESELHAACAARDSRGGAGSAVLQRMLVLVCYFVAPYGLMLLRL